MQLVRDMLKVNERDITYRSTLASSSSSRAFSLVGCHIGIAKYLTMKGHTSSFDRVAEMKNAMCVRHKANGKQNRDYLQIDFVIEQFAKGLFAGGLQKDHSEK